MVLTRLGFAIKFSVRAGVSVRTKKVRCSLEKIQV